MQVAILGPLEVNDDGGAPVVISGARLRDLIVRLALAGGRPVSTGELGDAVWGDEPPADLANALQTLVSRARRALGGAQAVEQSAAGYRLAITPGDVDALRFERLLGEGRIQDAMALWRGPALADAGEFAGPHAQRLERLQLDAMVALLSREVADDPAGGHVGALEVLAAHHPLDEKVTGLLMRALAATGRQAEALAAYGAIRERLADELGIDPGAELQAVHLEVLRGEAAAGNGAKAAGGPTAPAAAADGAVRARTNLRAQLTSFVGREDDVARVAKALGQYRLVTLVGPGGTGKTRLAAEVAAAAAASAADGGDGASAGDDDVSDGVWLAELASVTDPADVAQSILGSIGLREPRLLLDGTARTGNRDARTRLLDGLADARALLVLDNCEHLIDACAHLADELLSHCPGLRILATSREPLGITGESLLSIAPLSQPAPGAPAQEAVGFPAVRLFAERAAAVSPGFEVTDETVALVIDIVRRLDGLPLAIELAAARLRTLPLAEIARRLNDRFRLLTGGSRTALPRHRTLRAVVEWSWELLTPQERLLAERFAIFPAGATPDAVAAVCAGPGGPADGGGRAEVDPADVDDLLSSLVDKSLLQPVREAQGQAAGASGGRLRMLETVREYGTERLAGRGELAELLRRHAEHYSALMAEAAPLLLTRDQVTWLPLVQADRDNILAALRYWCDVEDAWQALTLAVGVSGMAMLLGNYSDITDWVGQALAVPASVTAGEELRTIAEALYQINQNMQMYEKGPANGPPAAAAAAAAEPSDLAERVDALDYTRLPLIGLLREMYAFFSDDRERLGRYIDEAIASGNEWLVAVSWMMRATLAENDGEIDALRIAADGALQRYRVLGERWGLSNALRLTGTLRLLDGDLDGATDAYNEALAALGELGSRDDEFMLRLQLADLATRRGDLASAREGFESAVAAVKTGGWGPDEAIILAACARFEVAAGNNARARELYTSAAARLRGISHSSPIWEHLGTIVESAGALVALGDGQPALARERAAAAHRTAIAAADMPLIASVALVAAELVLALGDPARAAELLGAAAVVRGADDPTAMEVRSLSERLRLALGEQMFAASQAQGAELDRAAALALLESSLSG
ncbi:MAG TPA: BTAD domain-containing putative transcriptional regulator [Trebonia sp.]|nr:BTAD domain-containing putative transcriptional regulator [Trebonia sp.]